MARTPKNIPFIYNKAIPPFFSFRVKWRFLILVQSVGLTKKKKLKKNNKKSRNRRPWYTRMTLQVNIHIFGLTKCTIYYKKCTCFFSMLLLCSFFRLKELFQVKNGLTTSVFCKFFCENAKNLDYATWRKKRMAYD